MSPKINLRWTSVRYGSKGNKRCEKMNGDIITGYIMTGALGVLILLAIIIVLMIDG